MFKNGDKVYHSVYGPGIIKSKDAQCITVFRYEVLFDRYPGRLITVVGDEDMRMLDTSVKKTQEGAENKVYPTKENKENIRQLVDSIFKIGSEEAGTNFAKIFNSGIDNEKLAGKKENAKVVTNKRKLTVDNNGNVVGGAIFGNNNPHDEIAPMFGAMPVSKKSEPDNVARHRKIVMGLNELYARKNADYGDSFHDTYIEEGMAMARIRLSDKLNRFKSLTRNNQQQVKDESVRDTLLDLANYAIMTVIEMDREADAKVGA